MRTECKIVYKYDELTDKAKEKARTWWRQGGLDYEWWDSSFEDFTTIGNILGIDFKNIANNGVRPAIYFSGFWSQGDGASFAGSWTFDPDAITKLNEYAPLDTELHRIALVLKAIAVSYADNNAWEEDEDECPLSASITQGGHSVHRFTMQCESDDPTGDSDEQLLDTFRDFAYWMYKNLESQFNYLNSDESVVESIECNEYEFNEDGSRA